MNDMVEQFGTPNTGVCRNWNPSQQLLAIF